MSYNVTGFTIKKLDAFTLPYDDVLKMTKGAVCVTDTMVHIFDQFEVGGMEIVGTMDGERLHVTGLYYSGEYSGTYWDIGFEPLVLKSTGTLRALIVWEGGDTVEMVTIENGVITREDI